MMWSEFFEVPARSLGNLISADHPTVQQPDRAQRLLRFCRPSLLPGLRY